jgi:hypothetical protein
MARKAGSARRRAMRLRRHPRPGRSCDWVVSPDRTVPSWRLVCCLRWQPPQPPWSRLT